MSKAVIYTRVSSDEQIKNQSLASQQKACREYCQRQGFEVDRVFVDEGQSAKTTERIEFQKMLAHCRQNKGRVEFVVVWKIDRFSRDRLDHALVVAHLRKLGISLRSVTEPIDGTSTGKLMEGILSTFAQFDNDVRGERTAAGMKSAMAAGRVTHLAPLGYLNTTSATGEPTLTPDPERAPLIRHAFEMFASGLHGKGEIMATLTKQGLRTLKGNIIHKQSFAQYLENPIYTGWLVSKKWNVRKRGNFEPIVDEATFAKVQCVLNGSVQSKRPHLRNHPDFPLRTFAKCGHCGRPLTGSKSTGRLGGQYAYYHCTDCGETRERKETFEAAFVALLKTLQPTPEAAKMLRELVLEEWQAAQAGSVATAAATTGRLNELQGKKDKLVEAYVYHKAIDEPTYRRHLDKLSEEMTLAEMAAQDARVDELDVEGILSFAETVLLNVGRLWTEYGLDQRQRLQQIVFPQGVTYQNGAFGTPETCWFYRVFEHFDARKTKWLRR